MFWIESCAQQQIWVDNLSKKRVSAQIRIEQHSDCRWRRAKAWKRCQAWFWIMATKVCRQTCRKWNATCLRKGVCSDSNQTAQRLQVVANKSLKTMSGMILNWLQPKFAAYVVISVNRLIFTWRFSEQGFFCKQSSTVLLTKDPLLNLEDLS